MTTVTTAAACGSKDFCAADISQDVHLVASDVGEMRVAQAQLAEWFANKLIICQRELADMAECIQEAERAKMNATKLKRLLARCQGRVNFFEKCQAAAEAGYCLVPNMNASVFALRVRSPRIHSNQRTYSRSLSIASEPLLNPSFPIGQGEYFSPIAQTDFVLDGRSEEPQVKRFYATELLDVEFPISVARPEIMSETVRGMALKCFDAMEVLPGGPESRRTIWSHQQRNGDPIVLGVIRHPRSGRWDRSRDFRFLIAWYINTKDLDF